MSDKRAHDRWLEAQKHEERYWQGIPQNLSNEKTDSSWITIWQRGVGQLWLSVDSYSFFEGKDIFEIGPGPYGVIYSIPNAHSRHAVEPMAMPNLEEWKREIVRKGIGEKIEHADGSFDIVICLNVLDHCADPSKVISEVRRVLRRNGKFLLWVHTIRQGYRFLTPIIEKVDGPHPYHFTIEQLQNLVANEFDIEHIKVVNGLGVDGHLPSKGNIKIFFGNFLMQNVWMTMVPKL